MRKAFVLALAACIFGTGFIAGHRATMPSAADVDCVLVKSFSVHFPPSSTHPRLSLDHTFGGIL